MPQYIKDQYKYPLPRYGLNRNCVANSNQPTDTETEIETTPVTNIVERSLKEQKSLDAEQEDFLSNLVAMQTSIVKHQFMNGTSEKKSKKRKKTKKESEIKDEEKIGEDKAKEEKMEVDEDNEESSKEKMEVQKSETVTKKRSSSCSSDDTLSHCR